MRYNLEIQPSSIGIIFVEQGKEIPGSAVPVLYTNVNETNIVPKDLVEIELSSKFKSYTDLPIDQTSATEFTVASNKVLITTVARFSKITGSRSPVFYKHVIKLDSNRTILDKSVRILNESNMELDKDMFVLESATNEAYVYLNPVDDSILWIEYSDQDKAYREMLKLEPAFKDVSSSFLTAGNLTQYEFACLAQEDGSFKVFTISNAPKFIASKKDLSSILPPVGNIGEAWYLRVDNITTNSTGASGENIQYHLAEYEDQRISDAISDPNFSSMYKLYTDQIAKIVNGNYIKLQAIPNTEKLTSVDIIIKEKTTLKTVYAFTTDNSKKKLNTSISGIVWTPIDDYNYDGIFKLPISIDSEYYYAYATYYTTNDFFEYRLLNLNAIDASHAKMIAIYIKPYETGINIGQKTIAFAFIGNIDERANSEKFMSNGAGFETKDEYINFLNEYFCINLCYTSIAVNNLYKLLDITYCGTTKEQIINEYELAKEDIDFFKRDLLNDQIRLSTSDVAYANIDNGIYTGDETKDTEYINFVKDVISKNICVSSNFLLRKNLISWG